MFSKDIGNVDMTEPEHKSVSTNYPAKREADPTLLEVESPLVVVKPAEGKGKGLFTTRKIQAGEILLREKPLLSVEHDENEEPPSLDDVCANFYKLSVENQKKILCLRSRHPSQIANNIEEDDEDYTELERIISLNLREQKNEAGKSVLVVYEKSIFTNNSCSPNAMKATVTSWDSNKIGPGDTVVVKAIKDIPENTEVTINYLSNDSTVIGSRAERQKVFEKWLFSCKCEVCSLVGDDLAKNEEIRLKLKVHLESWNLMQDKCFSPDCPDGCEMLSLDDFETFSEMMDLLEQIKYEAICLLATVNWMLMIACQKGLVPTEGKVPFKHCGYYEEMNDEFDKLLFL